MRRFLFIIGVVMLFSASSAHAEWETLWDFTENRPVEGWQIQGLEVRQGPDGLHIRGEGIMMHAVNASHPIDVVQIVFAKSLAVPMVLAWHNPGDPNDKFTSMFLNLKNQSPDTQMIPVHLIPQWNRWADVIGLQIQTQEEIVIPGIRLQGWSFPEKLWQAWKTFWIPDATYSYSINFFWGPILHFTPPEAEAIFTTQPPNGWSVHRITYPFLLFFAVVILLAYFTQRLHGIWFSKRGAILSFFVIVGSMFALHDIRMGYEFLWNAKSDLQYFSFQEPGKRTFRNLLGFHDALYRHLPLLTSVPKYAIFVPDKTPFHKMTAYHTYPKSRPLFDDESTMDATVYFVFLDNRYSINEKNELVRNGTEVLSKPGHIVERINENSFVFQVP